MVVYIIFKYSFLFHFFKVLYLAENNKAYLVVSFAIVLILIGILLPIGLSGLTAYNGTYTNASNSSQVLGTNSTMATLVSTIIPVIIVISLVLALLSHRGEDN